MTDDQAVAVDPAERPEEHPTDRPAADDGRSTSTAHCRIALYYED